jgi:uncharacterized membrane protein YqhA
MHRFITVSRYIVLLAIFATALAALAALLYGAIATVRITIDLFASADVFVGSVDKILLGVKHASVAFIELIDLILLGTVLYIVAIGLYQLFIDPDLELPAWLQTSDLDGLKQKLLGVVIVLLGVTFLSDATEWDGSPNFLTYGLSIAGVVLALTAYITAAHWTHRRKHEHPDEHKPTT